MAKGMAKDMERYGRNPLVINDYVVTVPVAPEVQQAMNDWFAKHLGEIDAVLAPFGLEALDVKSPTLEQVVYARG